MSRILPRIFLVSEILFPSFMPLASICRSEVNRSNCDLQWWKDHKNCMDRIGKLRNDCCHSGSNFDAAKLGLLIHYIFELPTLASIEVYDDIIVKFTLLFLRTWEPPFPLIFHSFVKISIPCCSFKNKGIHGIIAHIHYPDERGVARADGVQRFPVGSY